MVRSPDALDLNCCFRRQSTSLLITLSLLLTFQMSWDEIFSVCCRIFSASFDDFFSLNFFSLLCRSFHSSSTRVFVTSSSNLLFFRVPPRSIVAESGDEEKLRNSILLTLFPLLINFFLASLVPDKSEIESEARKNLKCQSFSKRWLFFSAFFAVMKAQIVWCDDEQMLFFVKLFARVFDYRCDVWGEFTFVNCKEKKKVKKLVLKKKLQCFQWVLFEIQKSFRALTSEHIIL